MAIKILGRTFGSSTSAPTTDAPAPIEQEPPGRQTPDRWREEGATGTVVYSGFLDGEEYNPDLRGSKAIDTYNKMAKSDGTVKSMLRILSLPMRTATLDAEATDDTPEAEYIARACEYALGNMPGITADDFRRQAFVGAFTYGHAAFEQAYVDAEGNVNLVDFEDRQVLMPYKLAPRLQKSIYRWLIDRAGNLRGIQQRVWVSNYDESKPVVAGDALGQMTHLAGGNYQFIDIPAERLCLFSFDREGANYLGESVLRSAYKHYFYKDNFLRMLAVGIERHLVGTPYAIVKQNIAPNERNAIVESLSTLRSHEKSYLIANVAQLASPTEIGMNPIGFLDMPTLGGNGRMVDLAIQYHDRQMALSILADFLSLGSGLGGNANVMSRDKTSYFFLALEGYAQAFTDTLERQVLTPMVELNWPGAKVPRLRLNGLEAKDLDRLGTAIAHLITAGGITADAEVENVLRELTGLPTLPEGPDGKPIKPEPVVPPIDPTANPNDLTKTPPPGKQPNDTQEQLVARLRQLADTAGGSGATALLGDLGGQLAAAAKRVADPDDDYTISNFIEDAQRLMLAAYLLAYLLGLAQRAFNGVAEGSGAGADAFAAAAAAGQRTYLERFGSDLQATASAKRTIAAAVAAGLEPPSIAIITDDEIETRANLYAAPVWTAYQAGRVAGAGEDMVVIWHAEGDVHTCDLCAERDGKEYTPATLPGFPGDGLFGQICKGGPNCRCWLELKRKEVAA